MKKILILIFILIFVSSVYAACDNPQSGYTCTDATKNTECGGIKVEGLCWDCNHLNRDEICPEDFGATCIVEDIDCVAPPPDCSLTTAEWVDADKKVEEGDTVSLKVESVNCEGFELSFDIWEDDWGIDDKVGTLPNPETIDSTGITEVSWVAEYTTDASGNPEYYFVAYLTVDSLIYIQSGLLEVSEKGAPPEGEEDPCDPFVLCLSPDELYYTCLDPEDCTDSSCSDECDTYNWYGDEFVCSIDTCDTDLINYPDCICDLFDASGQYSGVVIIEDFPIYDYWNLLVTVLILFGFYVFKKGKGLNS